MSWPVQGVSKAVERISKARYVQPKWFKEQLWLTLCTTRQKLFCFYCSSAARQNMLVFSKNADTAFVSSGFCNWRKASERFRIHETSHVHSEAMLKTDGHIRHLA
jgi:hypothetical protein